MNKKKSVILLVCLGFLLSVVNAAWILNYSTIITTNVISNERTFSFSHEFNDFLNLDTTNGINSTITYWEIEDLDEDLNVTFDISTHKENLTSEEICADYKKDCNIIVTHVYNNGTDDVRDLLTSTEGSSVTDEANFILFEDISNIIEYRIECAENSCPQEIESKIGIIESTNYYPEE
jgi:hypothetical protein